MRGMQAGVSHKLKLFHRELHRWVIVSNLLCIREVLQSEMGCCNSPPRCKQDSGLMPQGLLTPARHCQALLRTAFGPFGAALSYNAVAFS